MLLLRLSIIEAILRFIYLEFQNQSKLDKWSEKPEHDELLLDIEQYFIKPLEVEL